MLTPTQATLVRSVLKIGAGALVAKGVTDDATAEVIIAGLVAAISVLWGYLEKRNAGKPVDVPIKTLVLLAAIGLSTGCGTTKIEPGGAYNQDPVLFTADAAFDLGHTALDAAFAIEKKNRLFLWKLDKNIKKEMDSLRVKATQVKLEYALARQAYLDVPIPDNSDQLKQALAKLQALSAAATILVTNPRL